MKCFTKATLIHTYQVQLKETVDIKIAQLEFKCKQLEEKDAQLEEEIRLKDQQLKELLSYNARNAPEGAATDLRAVGSNANLRQGTTRMPTSCLDLKAAGFYLNGIYPVVGAQHIELVHCDFSKLTFDPSFQKWIGFADVKSAPTYFHVQRFTRDAFKQSNTTVLFNVEHLNVGGAMDVKTGIFTAPRAGKYFFSITGLAWFPVSSYRRIFYIGLYKNSNQIAMAHAGEAGTLGQWGPFSSLSTQNLQKGDKLSVEIYRISPDVYLNGNDFVYFTGWLMEEEVVLSL